MKRTILVAATSLLLAACGSERSGSYETEDGEKVDYSVDAGSGESSIDIKSDDGNMKIRAGADVAVDLPDGFSDYPGAEVRVAIVTAAALATLILICVWGVPEPRTTT